MNPTLSILCVSRGEPAILEILSELGEIAGAVGATFVLVADGEEAAGRFPVEASGIVHARGFIESALDHALEFAKTDFVLRLDDDELPSAAMIRWLRDREWTAADHWSFSRVHLWDDRTKAIVSMHLWPDHQTRLSIKPKAGGRKDIHSGSPYGMGRIAPVAIEHHKFLVKPVEERREIVKRYDGIAPGAGSRFRPYSVPEDVYPAGGFNVVPWNGEALP